MCVSVGESVAQSLQQWDRKLWDVAMLHACNAVDETGRKRYPTLGVGTRFRTALRDSLDIYGVMATPGVDLEKTRFPVGVRSDLLPDKRPDIALPLALFNRSCMEFTGGCTVMLTNPRLNSK